MLKTWDNRTQLRFVCFLRSWWLRLLLACEVFLTDRSAQTDVRAATLRRSFRSNLLSHPQHYTGTVLYQSHHPPYGVRRLCRPPQYTDSVLYQSHHPPYGVRRLCRPPHYTDSVLYQSHHPPYGVRRLCRPPQYTDSVLIKF